MRHSLQRETLFKSKVLQAKQATYPETALFKQKMKAAMELKP